MPDENTNSSSAVVVSDSIPNNSSTALTTELAADIKIVAPPVTVQSRTAPTRRTIPTPPPSVKAKVMTKPLNPSNVDKLQNLISKYEATLKENKETITDWINLCNYLNRTNDPKVFQAFYIWFAKHLKDYTSAEIALSGVHTIQNANTKVRVGSTHQCFEELARVLSSSKKSHYRFTVKAMQGMAISESLARWFFTKTSAR